MFVCMCVCRARQIALGYKNGNAKRCRRINNIHRIFRIDEFQGNGEITSPNCFYPFCNIAIRAPRNEITKTKAGSCQTETDFHFPHLISAPSTQPSFRALHFAERPLLAHSRYSFFINFYTPPLSRREGVIGRRLPR